MHDLISGLARGSGTAVVAVTHNRALAQRADRIVTLEDGVLRPAQAAEVLA
jgi:predicted ABC-type transport system involved in lysophospholipase L1 biosynthesis ATPase subunit